MSQQKTIHQRLQNIVGDCAYINADPKDIFSQKTKDDVRGQVNGLLDYVISQTDPRHIKVLCDEEAKKLMNRVMDAIRKENLERLKKDD